MNPNREGQYATVALTFHGDAMKPCNLQQKRVEGLNKCQFSISRCEKLKPPSHTEDGGTAFIDGSGLIMTCITLYIHTNNYGTCNRMLL